MKEIERQKTDINSIVESQETINALFEEQKKEIAASKRIQNNLLKNDTDRRIELENAKKSIKSLQECLTKSQNSINDLEQYGRRDMLNIRGIPKQDQEQEDTDDIAIKVAAVIGVNLKKDQIDVSHRTSGDDAPIIVKFDSRRSRDMFWLARKNLEGKTISDIHGFEGNQKIYINESLTAKNGELFKAARNKLKHLGYKYVWTKNGIVLAKKDASIASKKFSIRSLIELNKITQ